VKPELVLLFSPAEASPRATNSRNGSVLIAIPHRFGSLVLDRSADDNYGALGPTSY
jgi:hypothetical protein